MESQGPYKLVAPNARPTTAPEAVDYIIYAALQHDASDIHIGANHDRANPEAVMVRLRVHGTLHPLKSDFLQPMYRECISRLKVLASLDTTETSSPQDGQIDIEVPGGKQIVLRLNFIPSEGTEEMVARIQQSDEKVFALEQLAMTKEMLGRMQTLIHQKSGMIILNGPAGSGKTTTIYSILNTISSPEKKIITAEDPVESHLANVSHCQVTSKTNFAALSRAFMRQDADVIFIGEVRDNDSAVAAVQLAQTGHLVITSLHTRDSVGVISRLAAFDIPHNFIATSLIGSLSQRLVPRLCEKCRVEYQPEAALLKKMHDVCAPPEGVRFFHTGQGCDSCSSGIAGRLPIFELFVADAELSDLINKEASYKQIYNTALNKGMRSLGEEALFRVYGGYVDINSVYSFIFGPEY